MEEARRVGRSGRWVVMCLGDGGQLWAGLGWTGQLLLRGGRWQTGGRGGKLMTADGAWRGVICGCALVIVHTANCVEGTLYVCAARLPGSRGALFVLASSPWTTRRGSAGWGLPSFSFRQFCSLLRCLLKLLTWSFHMYLLLHISWFACLRSLAARALLVGACVCASQL